MKRGRLTIPTDIDFVEGTKKYIEKWGADAIRDCDGTELPKDASKLANKVYKTYFVVRGDNDFAYESDSHMQNIALISERFLATSNTLKINVLKNMFKEQIKVNPYEYKTYWQVFDRTEGVELKKDSFEYLGDDIVLVKDTKPYHEYTVNFFGYSLWDPTQVYNYNCNGWTKTKDRDYDPIYPDVLEHILSNLDNWLKNNPNVNVVRFTTFFYHFYILYHTGTEQTLSDWYNFAMTASPKMFEMFKKEYGYEIKLEDLVTEGYYANHFISPSKTMLDYIDLVERFVTRTMKKIIDKVHSYNKEAMMFWGDSWIGAEPYSKHFKDMGLDAVVGSVNSGLTVRAVSDIENIKYREIRLLPYFFPDTLYDDDIAKKYLLDNWRIERRAILRKPVDRIGFGGYLKLADKLPKFTDAVERLCDEFRTIYDIVDNKKPYSVLKIAIISAWGKEKSWMNNMAIQDVPFSIISPYLGVLECLCGLPVDISFISFDDVKKAKLSEYDALLNIGISGTAFSGGDLWRDPILQSVLREYVAQGGGFIGIGEPSATLYQGRFFQLADILGVDEEKGFTVAFNRFNAIPVNDHFIKEDLIEDIDYANTINNIYAFNDTTVLDARCYTGELGTNNSHIKMATSDYLKGRSFYSTGFKCNSVSSRLMYRALLYVAHKEDELYKAYSSNVYTECHYYPSSKKYVIVNNSDALQNTIFYDINGNKKDYQVEPNGLIVIDD